MQGKINKIETKVEQHHGKRQSIEKHNIDNLRHTHKIIFLVCNIHFYNFFTLMGVYFVLL